MNYIYFSLRYWSVDTVYSHENGGNYSFVTEYENLKALPLDSNFWDDLFRGASSRWGLNVYEQDWMDRQYLQMNVCIHNIQTYKCI